MSLEKYHGVIPAFYACYEDDGAVSVQRTRQLARYLVNKGVKGLYVGAPPENAFIWKKKSA